MKKIWNIIAILAIASFAFACMPEYPELSQGSVPEASTFDVQIDVDQETNYVTFNLKNPGMTPIWIFGSDQLIDGKQNKKYSYTGNGLQLRFREAGTYSVEVKAYNTFGTSVGSVVKNFSLENTYRDPFDPSPYIRALSGGASQDWVWNSTENGHFGCGPVGNPLGWWSCEANGKSGFLYDDVFTFDNEGKYTYTSADGMAYANKGSEFSPESKTADEDYLFPVENKTYTYTFENEWTEEGIEQIYLVLESGAILSYVPHKSIVESPRYLVMEKTTANMKKKLQLMATVYTPDNTDGISWYYEFVPKGSNTGAADPLFGLDSKTWVLDNETQGYMGCGPDFGNPTGWWNGAAHDKDAFGVKDDEITFFANGKYVFDPGEDGKVYVNKDSNYHPELRTGDEDYDAPAERQESTYTLGSDDIADYIELPAGILFGYIPNAAVVDDQPNRLHIKELSANKLIVVTVYDGISWQFIYRPKDGQVIGGGDEPEEVEPLDLTQYDLNGSTNLWKAATITPELWYSPGDWSGGLNPDYTINADNGITVTIPDGVGGSEWMAQTKLKSGIASSSSKKYDLSVTLLASEDMTVTIKLTNDPEENDDIHSFFYDGSVKLTAGEPLVYRRSNLSQSVSGDNVMLIFDFGRSPIGSTITASDIIFQEHKEAANLWAGATITPELWYSPGDWSGGLNPDYTINADNGITVTIPDGVGGSEWMAQTKLKSGVATSSDKTYAFSVELLADEDMTVTIKLTNDPEENDDIHSFFYDGSVKLTAGEKLLYVKRGVKQSVSGNNLMLIFDFGRSPIGSTITASSIIFIEE